MSSAGTEQPHASSASGQADRGDVAAVPPTRAAPAPPTLDEIRKSDLYEVAGFIHREVTGLQPTAPVHTALSERLRWLLEDNPARRPEVPWGWLVRDAAGGIVGAMPCIPQRFTHQNKEYLALMSAKFYVNEAHRGAGVGIFMRYAALGKQFPLFCTTAGVQSVALWKKFGAYEIPNQEHELIGAARWSGLIEEAAFRRTGQRTASRATGAVAMLAPRGLRRFRPLAAGTELTKLSRAAEVIALKLPSWSEQVTAVRDEAFIQWRHFSGPDAADRGVYAFRTRNSEPSLVIVQLAPRGYRAQIRALQVLDLWGPIADADMPRLAAALARKYAGQFDVLIFRSQPPARQAALQAVGRGFMHRKFEAPVAWCIDRHKLLPTQEWYLVPADAE